MGKHVRMIMWLDIALATSLALGSTLNTQDVAVATKEKRRLQLRPLAASSVALLKAAHPTWCSPGLQPIPVE